jgi:hypothetical protein
LDTGIIKNNKYPKKPSGICLLGFLGGYVAVAQVVFGKNEYFFGQFVCFREEMEKQKAKTIGTLWQKSPEKWLILQKNTAK